MRKLLKRTAYFIAGLIVIYLFLLIPDAEDRKSFVDSSKTVFAWNRDEQWLQMEDLFRRAKQMQTDELDSIVSSHKKTAENELSLLASRNIISSSDSGWINIENNFFVLASLIAVQQEALPWFIDYYNRVRNLVKLQSQQWDINKTPVRDKLYTLLYGMRAALEEVLLQSRDLKFAPAMQVKAEKTITASASILGIEVHSGDLLVSRGGAEVSALISRGNNYPGNFSHVALVYIDEKDNQPFLIEAHIEKGVAVSTVKQYEQDKKLRFMVMRPRADLPMMIADPMLPQKAAQKMFDEAERQHIPYDFKMNFFDSSAMFCSEVASYAYRSMGIQIWKYPSTISSGGVINWLHDFGVENFVTQMPSDLEYDPQLSIVAEWRDPETLFKDHIDNAAMDALLERADKGETIGYNTWELPFVRVLKGYCLLKNLFGEVGIIPEGMSATQALKNQSFVAMHVNVKNNTTGLAADFIKQNGYRPPYWQLIKFAEAASAGNKN